MGCLYEANDGSGCTMRCEEIEMNGCDETGQCVCSCDPDPSYMCEVYESDWSCSECGQDMNVEECNCEDEDNEC